MTERDPSLYVFWLASRSAGIVAFVLVSASVLIGLYLAANVGRRRVPKRMLVKVHEQIALAALVAIAAHGLLLLGDKWLSPGIGGLVVPFTMSYRPAFTGIGQLAGILAFVLGLSFYARRRVGPKRWRKAHRLMPVVYVLGAVHALGAGSDGSGLSLQGLVIVTAVPMAGLLIARYRPRGQPTARPVRATAATE